MVDSTFTFNTLIQQAQEIGFYQVIVPFLLVFAIVYGILESIGLFENKGIKAVIAFVLGLLVTGSGIFTETIQSFTPYLGVVIFFLLSFIVVLGLTTGKKLSKILGTSDEGGMLMGAIGAFIFGILVWIFAISQGWGIEIGGGTFQGLQENLGIIIGVVVILIGIAAVVWGGGSSGDNQ